MGADGPGGRLTERVVGLVRTMIATRELIPGSPVRQELLADRLGLSRQPVREALTTLASDGLLDHRRNVGYTVRVLSRDELEQAYLLRRLIESELLRTLPDPAALVEPLRTVNQALAEAAAEADWAAFADLNHAFHFTVFEAAGLELLTAELSRVWFLTQAYRAVYVGDPVNVARIFAEHGRMIAALADGDTGLLIELHDRHRAGTLAAVRRGSRE